MKRIYTLIPWFHTQITRLPFTKASGMDDMVESIREHGIVFPIVVKSIYDSKYVILSGHNRVEATKRLGLVEIPVIDKDGLSDEDAALIITETNLIQR